MAKVIDVTSPHTTGLNHIDALLDSGPAWNYMTPAGNSLVYTFSVASGNEDGRTDVAAFSSTQQANTRSLLSYISSVTGINFVETTNGAAATLHFAMNDITDPGTAGLCSWSSSYNFDGQNNLTSYSASAYVYLDSAEWGTQNRALAAGNEGYETLLHEMGHALGLKHPFDGTTRLPTGTDNTSNTVMSYTSSGGPYSTFNPFDVAALNWLYGGDGLAGARGLNSTADGRYLMGSAVADNLTTAAGNDILVGLGGSDVLDGGAGFDKAMYASARSNFSLSNNGSSFTLVDNTGALGSDILTNIERIHFSDKVIAFDTSGDAGKLYRLYQAAFDRVPDSGGLGYWINVMEKGYTLQQIASGFTVSAEFKTLYGTNPTPEAIMAKFYNNVLHREADPGGIEYWANVMRNGGAVAGILEAFSESPENQANLIGTIQNGMEYTPFFG